MAAKSAELCGIPLHDATDKIFRRRILRPAWRAARNTVRTLVPAFAAAAGRHRPDLRMPRNKSWFPPVFPAARIHLRHARFWLMVAASLVGSGAALAQSIVLTNFSSTAGFQLNGTAAATTTGDGTILRLAGASANQNGSLYTTAQRSVGGGFSTAFQFRLSSRGGISDGVAAGADGFVFVLQRIGAGSLGTAGEGMGYGGVGSSVGIEFDTFLNPARSDPTSNHVGVNTGGSVTSLATAGVTPDFDSAGTGSIWTAWIDYNGATLEIRVNNSGIRPGSALLSHSLNIASTVGGSSAFVGFSAATGAAFANHDILNWTFSDAFVLGGVMPGVAIPEPATAAMLAAGLVLFALAGRRRVRRGR
jgi:hypothetical protein